MGNTYRILVGSEKSRRRREDDIKMVLQEMGWQFLDWNRLVQARDQLQFLWTL
jgi:hypothetical protein